MKYYSVSEFAKKQNLPERTVRNYCATGKIAGAFLTGRTWNIPEEAVISDSKNRKDSAKTHCLIHSKNKKI